MICYYSHIHRYVAAWTVRSGRINLSDKLEVILALWEGGRWTPSEADVLSVSKEETSVFCQHGPTCVSEAIAWSCKVMLAPDSIFGHPSEVSAKDARECQTQWRILKNVGIEPWQYGWEVNIWTYKLRVIKEPSDIGFNDLVVQGQRTTLGFPGRGCLKESSFL